MEKYISYKITSITLEQFDSLIEQGVPFIGLDDMEKYKSLKTDKFITHEDDLDNYNKQSYLLYELDNDNS